MRVPSSVLCVFVSMVLATQSGWAANTWHVDRRKPANGDGQTWATAWNRLAAIRWDSVKPGDTVLLSGGTTNLVYSESLEIGSEGRPGAPIRIGVGREPGHNGTVIIEAPDRSGIQARDWVTIDGGRADISSASYLTNTLDVPSITNNIGMKVVAVNGVNYTRSGPRGMVIRWLEIVSSKDADEHNGIRVRASAPYDQRESEVAFCWIHDVGQDGITVKNGVPNPAFDQFVVHHCLIERVGDDGLEINAGCTIHHSIIRDSRAARGHSDGIQATGNYQRYFNNVISDFTSSYVLVQGVKEGGPTYGPVWIYGNLMRAVRAPCSATMLELKWYPVGWNTTDSMCFSNWVIANNTLVGSTNGAFGIFKRDNLLPKASLRSILFVNNIVYDAQNWVGTIPHGASDRPSSGAWDTPPGAVVFDYNTIAASTLGQRRAVPLTIFGQKFDSMGEVSRISSFKSNRSERPAFENVARGDFRPSRSDRTVRDTAMDLKSLGLPGIEQDLRGIQRGFDGWWDRGALEATER